MTISLSSVKPQLRYFLQSVPFQLHICPVACLQITLTIFLLFLFLFDKLQCLPIFPSFSILFLQILHCYLPSNTLLLNFLACSSKTPARGRDLDLCQGGSSSLRLSLVSGCIQGSLSYDSSPYVSPLVLFYLFNAYLIDFFSLLLLKFIYELHFGKCQFLSFCSLQLLFYHHTNPFPPVLLQRSMLHQGS